jgi:hypothetical protein
MPPKFKKAKIENLVA